MQTNQKDDQSRFWFLMQFYRKNNIFLFLIPARALRKYLHCLAVGCAAHIKRGNGWGNKGMIIEMSNLAQIRSMVLYLLMKNSGSVHSLDCRSWLFIMASVLQNWFFTHRNFLQFLSSYLTVCVVPSSSCCRETQQGKQKLIQKGT